MKSFFLDTSVIIDYLRGKKEAVELLNNLDGQMTSSYLCLSELYEGVHRVKEKEEVEGRIKKFFSSLSEVYALNENTAKKFGELRAELKKQGKVIEDIDIFLAATCLVYGEIMVTFNKKHFSHIQGLQIL